MKTAIVIAAALVTLTSLPLFAQQVDASAQQNTKVKAGASQTNESASATTGPVSGTASAEQMLPVDTQLEGKLDSKSAKVGDTVVVKTKQALKTADGTEIPRGTRLVGHVTSVQAHGKESADSSMAIDFDRADLKGGQSMPIHSVIQSVEPPPSAAMASSMQGDDSMAGGMDMGGRGGGGRVMGGGMPGGSALPVGGAVGGVARMTGRTAEGLGSTADQGLQTTGQVAGRGVASVGRGADLAGGAEGSLAAHATGVRGVMLAGGAGDKVSGTLSAAKQNIHLDGGTEMVLGIAAVR